MLTLLILDKIILTKPKTLKLLLLLLISLPFHQLALLQAHHGKHPLKLTILQQLFLAVLDLNSRSVFDCVQGKEGRFGLAGTQQDVLVDYLAVQGQDLLRFELSETGGTGVKRRRNRRAMGRSSKGLKRILGFRIFIF